MNWLLIPLCAYLYRWGGGDIWPFKKGWKPARRYLLPSLLALAVFQAQFTVSMIILSLITHFNLQEIEDRNWEEIALYGFGQAWCFSILSGFWSGLLAAFWILGVWISNESPWAGKFDWRYVELTQGAVMGGLVAYAL